jgi:outer membrane protein TolC
MRFIPISLAAILSAVPLASAAPSDEPLSLALAVDHALERNLGLKIRRYNPAIEAGNVVIEDAAFDLQLTAGAGLGKDKVAATGAEFGNGALSAGISKKFSTGATVDVSTNLDHDSSSVTGDGAGLSASITQPLLRGAWADVSLAELRKAKSRLTAAELQLRSDTLDLVLDVEGKYWDLSHAAESVKLAESSVEAARQLVEEVKAKRAANQASDVDLLEAQASLASKQNLLTQARQNHAQAADTLAQVMGDLMGREGAVYEPSVAELPFDATPAPDFASLWPTILSEDIAGPIQEESVRRADIDNLVAKNGRRPQLDLVLSGGYSGSGYSEGDAYDSLGDRDGHTWKSRLAFSMPIGRRENIARSRQASAKLEQEKLGLLDTRQTLFQKARQAWRDVNMNLERCASTAAGVEYQQKAFEMANVKFQNGLITFRQLLDSQSDYDSARQSHIDALRDLALARATMARLDGTLARTVAPETPSK